MPQIIDLEALQKDESLQTFEPKYLHPSFTGSPTRNGFFNKDNYTIEQMNENKSIALQTANADVIDDVEQFCKASLIEVAHKNKIMRGSNHFKSTTNILENYYPEVINKDFDGNDAIKRANKTTPFHFYLKNKRFMEPISAKFLYENAFSLNGMTLKKDEWHLLNLNRWIDAIEHNDKDNDYYVETMNMSQTDYRIYQKAFPTSISAFGMNGQVNAHIHYMVGHLIVPKDITQMNQIKITDHTQLKKAQFQDLHTATLIFTPVFTKPIGPLKDNIKETSYKENLREIMVVLNQPTDYVNFEKTYQSYFTQLQNQNVHSLFTDNCKHKSDVTKDIHTYFNILHRELNRLKYVSLNKTENIETETTYLMMRLLGAIECVNRNDTIISLNEMSHIFQELQSLNTSFNFSKNFMRKLQSVSLIMELNIKLAQLATQKNQLTKFNPQNALVKQQLATGNKYSVQQKAIIASEEPLIIGQAGAGSGKSHTILGRIDYLRYQGVDLNKVLVLSFTNVAAENIIKRWPNIKSKTIASMMDEIYQLNFNHGLSQAGTLVNAVNLIEPKSDYFANLGIDSKRLSEAKSMLISVMNEFKNSYNKNARVQKSNNLLTKELNNIVANYFKEVVAILDAIEQTTLELEPIMVLELMRQYPDKLKMPTKYKDIEFIITDESQDISAFEYILLLECVLYYKSQLLIVGDGSQTLYEFRSADPRCLTTLELSGVFKTYKLETNYRSNQEILTYANQFLTAIDANKQAQIQLQANNLKDISMKSFKNRVKLSNVIRDNDLSRDERIKEVMLSNQEFKNYVMDCLYANQQVAVLTWTRREKDAAKEALESIINEFKESDNFKVDDITTIRSAPTTFLSTLANYLDSYQNTLKAYLDSCKQGSIKDATLKQSLMIDWSKTLQKTIRSKGDYIGKRITETLENFINSESFDLLIKSYISSKNMTISEFNGHLKQMLLQAEIKANNLRNIYLQNMKENVDYSNMKCVVSTIHGAKGLEFDNVIIFYDEKATRDVYSEMRSIQQELRLFFVAFSRAKQTEWIINFHSAQKSASSNDIGMLETPIRTAYLKTIETLYEKEKLAQTAN